MDPTSQEAGPSSFTTPKTDQGEWSSSSTPSRHTFPRRLSLLQNDTSSPVRATAEDARTSSAGGPKPLSLGSHPVTSAAGPSGSGATDTPRRGKRTSLSYIPSPSTSVKAVSEVQLSRAPSTTSTASGRTRTGSISRATAPRRPPSQSSQTANSDADDWLMSEEDASFSFPSAARAMAQRDSAKVEAQFHDVGFSLARILSIASAAAAFGEFPSDVFLSCVLCTTDRLQGRHHRRQTQHPSKRLRPRIQRGRCFSGPRGRPSPRPNRGTPSSPHLPRPLLLLLLQHQRHSESRRHTSRSKCTCLLVAPAVASQPGGSKARVGNPGQRT